MTLPKYTFPVHEEISWVDASVARTPKWEPHFATQAVLDPASVTHQLTYSFPANALAALDPRSVGRRAPTRFWDPYGPIYVPSLPQSLRAEVLTYYGQCCWYCNIDLLTLPVEQRHVDHYYPKSLRPLDANAFSNLRAACAGCNLSKGSKLPEEWLASRPDLYRVSGISRPQVGLVPAATQATTVLGNQTAS